MAAHPVKSSETEGYYQKKLLFSAYDIIILASVYNKEHGVTPRNQHTHLVVDGVSLSHEVQWTLGKTEVRNWDLVTNSVNQKCAQWEMQQTHVSENNTMVYCKYSSREVWAEIHE